MTPEDSQAYRPELEGWAIDILPWLRAIAPKLPKPFTYYEAGVYCGRSLIFLAEEAHKLGHGADTRLVGIDMPVLAPNSQRVLLANIDKYRPAWGSVTVELDLAMSVEAAARMPDASADLVFIDADHQEASVRADILAWRSKVRSGGILAGHDYSHMWPGVKAAVDALLGTVNHQDSVWWVVT